MKRNRITFCLACLFPALWCPGIVSAAEDIQFDFVKQLGGTNTTIGSDTSRHINLDASGNIFVSGDFTGTVDFDPGESTYNMTSANGADGFIAKYDSAGAFQWAVQSDTESAPPSSESNLHIDGSGNSYISFDRIVKLDLTGNELTSYPLTSATGGAWFGGVRFNNFTVDNSGNIYHVGNFGGFEVDFDPGPGETLLTSQGCEPNTGGGQLRCVGGGDTYITKTDAAGNFQWASIAYGTNWISSPKFVEVENSSGNTYVIGVADEDGEDGSSAYTRILIRKFDNSGVQQWIGIIEGASFQVYDSAITDNNEIYVLGTFEGTVDFDPGPSTTSLTAAGGWDIFFLKLNSSGDLLFAKQLGGPSYEYGFGLALDDTGDIHVTGGLYGPGDYNPGPGTATLIPIGLWDIFISKYSSTGDFIWAKSFGGSNIDIGYGIASDASSNVYSVGNFSGTVDFYPSAGTHELTSVGGFDHFLLKNESRRRHPMTDALLLIIGE